jgi:hypothetical protein
MDIFETYKRQLNLAKEQFSHIVEAADVIPTPSGLPHKLRLEIIDGSVVDVFLSSQGRYSYHWERRHIDGTLYRHDNAPHNRWRHVETFPKHFHNGSEEDEDGKESYISEIPEEAVREFLRFIEGKLAQQRDNNDSRGGT